MSFDPSTRYVHNGETYLELIERQAQESREHLQAERDARDAYWAARTERENQERAERAVLREAEHVLLLAGIRHGRPGHQDS